MKNSRKATVGVIICCAIAVWFYLKTNKTEHTQTVVHVQTQAEKDSVFNDAWYYWDDTAFANEYPKTEVKFFKKSEATIYFVKYWNTPDYGVDNSQAGLAWDGNCFFGYEVNDKVYFIDEYEVRSKRYLKETGDSILYGEKFFYKNGLTTDPRETCWWLSKIKDLSDSVNMDEALKEMTCIFDNSQFQPYLKELKERVLVSKGVNEKKKILNYTSQKIPGSPDKWDAWKWPGYYDGKKHNISALTFVIK